jgi:hypothetical protein
MRPMSNGKVFCLERESRAPAVLFYRFAPAPRCQARRLLWRGADKEGLQDPHRAQELGEPHGLFFLFFDVETDASSCRCPFALSFSLQKRDAASGEAAAAAHGLSLPSPSKGERKAGTEESLGAARRRLKKKVKAKKREKKTTSKIHTLASFFDLFPIVIGFFERREKRRPRASRLCTLLLLETLRPVEGYHRVLCDRDKDETIGPEKAGRNRFSLVQGVSSKFKGGTQQKTSEKEKDALASALFRAASLPSASLPLFLLYRKEKRRSNGSFGRRSRGPYLPAPGAAAARCRDDGSGDHGDDGGDDDDDDDFVERDSGGRCRRSYAEPLHGAQAGRLHRQDQCGSRRARGDGRGFER